MPRTFGDGRRAVTNVINMGNNPTSRLSYNWFGLKHRNLRVSVGHTYSCTDCTCSFYKMATSTDLLKEDLGGTLKPTALPYTIPSHLSNPSTAEGVSLSSSMARTPSLLVLYLAPLDWGLLRNCGKEVISCSCGAD